MQAIMLAAGMGNRLGKFTDNNTKCMLNVASKKLVDRAIEAVEYAGIDKFIFVVGYKAENLISYIESNYKDSKIKFEFVHNVDYAKTNNIYSFFLAKDYLAQDDTILLESDLIFDKTLIKEIVTNQNPNLVAVAEYESWMDGTVVTCDENDHISQFISKVDMDIKLTDSYYKTVNVYKFSKQFLSDIYLPFLKAYMTAYGMNSYYETVLKAVAHLEKSSLKAFKMNDIKWYEIDDAQDLDIANVMFSEGSAKYDAVISKFGGYWRYNKMLDFCYLVNPYFPPKAMVDKLQNEYPILLTQYPSGLNMQNMNAERMFNVDQCNLLVGNGAAELINALGLVVKGKVAVNLPTFNEYVRCFRNCELVEINNDINDYQFDLDRIKSIIKDVDYMMIISPENPSGCMLTKSEVLELCQLAKEYNTKLIIDESFIDFADRDKRYTLLDKDIIAEHPELCVVKSISKSYGIPGLRLGVLATSDVELLSDIRSYMQVWNINSFAEYFLQIYNLYDRTYKAACDSIELERKSMLSRLRDINGIKVFESQANYIMIDLINTNSYNFCVDMLDKYNILIKDLSTKNYFNNNNYIRIAVRDNNDNNILVNAMIQELS